MRGVTACEFGYERASSFTCSGLPPPSACEEAASGKREMQAAAIATRFVFIAALSPNACAQNVTRCRYFATYFFASFRTAPGVASLAAPGPGRRPRHASQLRELRADDRHARHEAGVVEHESHDRLLRRLGVDHAVRADMGDGDRRIRSGRPALPRAKLRQRVGP